MRITFIINSLFSRHDSTVAEIEALKPSFPDLTIAHKSTNSAGDAFRYSYQMAKKNEVDVIVACGGDGTVNEVLNGVAFAEEEQTVAFGVYAIGSANDLVKTIGQKTLRELLETAKSNSFRAFDQGELKFGSSIRKFANVSSAGMGGLVFRKVESSRGALPARFTYMLAIFKCILIFKRPRIRITMDDQSQELSITSLIIGNGNYVGFGLGFTPQADMNDGELGVTILRHSSYYQLLTKYPQLSKGKEVSHPWISYHKCKRLRIEVLEGRLPIETDGEFFSVLDAGEAVDYSISPFKTRWL